MAEAIPSHAGFIRSHVVHHLHGTCNVGLHVTTRRQLVDTLLASASPSRIGLHISASNVAGSVTCQPQATPVSTRGPVLAGTSPVIDMSYALHPGLTQAEWRAIASAGAVNVTVIEEFYEPERVRV